MSLVPRNQKTAIVEAFLDYLGGKNIERLSIAPRFTAESLSMADW